ncbi:MAG: flippase-like domain-containing protein, partial [Nitrospirae bacterium]|nr:flippase-like domain-containing protein [Nitrospirota bacterium]
MPARIGIHALLKRAVLLIPLGIAGNLLYLFLSSTGISMPVLSPLALIALALTALLAIVPWFTDSLRLFIWGRFLGARISYPELIRVVIGGELGAAVSPPVIGGSAVKTALMVRLGIPTGTAFSLTLLSGIEDSIVFLILVPLALTVSSSWDLPFVQHGLSSLYDPLLWAICGTVAAMVMILLLMRKDRAGCPVPTSETGPEPEASSRFRDRLRRGWRDFVLIFGLIAARGKARLALTLLISAFQWTCRYSVLTALVMSLGLPAQPLVFLSLQVILFAAMNSVPTPGAAGGAEALFTMLYRPFIPADSVTVVMIGWRFLTFYFPAILGAVGFAILGIRTPLTEKQREEPR